MLSITQLVKKIFGKISTGSSASGAPVQSSSSLTFEQQQKQFLENAEKLRTSVEDGGKALESVAIAALKRLKIIELRGRIDSCQADKETAEKSRETIEILAKGRREKSNTRYFDAQIKAADEMIKKLTGELAELLGNPQQ
jgi:hypothetical protein